jgi:hypothetical protein
VPLAELEADLSIDAKPLKPHGFMKADTFLVWKGDAREG